MLCGDTGVEGALFDAMRDSCRLLDSSWSWPEEERTSWQLDRLRELVQHSAANVAFYRERFSDSDIPNWAAFKTLPLTSRTEYSNAPQESKVAVRGPEHSRPLLFMKTSGTTGQPISIAATKLVRVWRSACILRECEKLGIDTLSSCAIIRTPVSPRDPDWDPNLGAARRRSWLSDEIRELVGMGAGYDFDIRQPLESIADGITKLKPDLLYGTPSMMLSLIDLVRGFAPKAIMTTSEQLFASERRKLEESYGCLVHDLFGTVEFNRVAFYCRECDLYHVHDENLILELLDESGNEVGPGQTGKLYGTSLHNLATPIIRYEIGDVAERPSHPNHCGSTLSSIKTFHGRQVSRIALPDGRFRVATGLVISLLDMPNCNRSQLHQEEFDQFKLLYVAPKEFDLATKTEIEDMLQGLIGTKPHLVTERVERIEPLPNGKTPPVIVSKGLLEARA